ncbi:DUF3025 domain-containing protein [Roseateles sp. DAIF2]|uniref:DUF3025 domain-containing protein n=1 Tax=Roseateles sp. DAIF2 TaxID=2714952 RepID=UPI00201DF1F1|nr:DUF3025 domain-containing protein [Roseateles sp. DAIF2]
MHRRWQAGASVAEALNGADAEAAMPRFVPQAELPAGEGYEAFIRRSGRVPTRDNLHDFFNGLVWLHRPALKARLNAWHGLEAQRGPPQEAGPQRGPLRDALTLLDENGALLHDAPPALAQALIERDWRRLFIELRPLWRGVRLEIVGHALLEKLQAPRKPICAHVLLAEPQDPRALAAKPFLPLPVLGLPGWWAANEDPGFYEDAAVFRPGRALQTG